MIFLYQRLTSQKGFVWLTRHISPKTQHDITQLGIPGIYLRKDYCRVYPYGPLVSHVLGYCGIDNNGLSGLRNSLIFVCRMIKHPSIIN